MRKEKSLAFLVVIFRMQLRIMCISLIIEELSAGWQRSMGLCERISFISHSLGGRNIRERPVRGSSSLVE